MNNMSIDEKAKDFACYSSFPDGSTKKEMDNRYDGFKAGAEWMLEKALKWFKHQKEEIGISWFDEYEIRFREDMDE